MQDNRRKDVLDFDEVGPDQLDTQRFYQMRDLLKEERDVLSTLEIDNQRQADEINELKA